MNRLRIYIGFCALIFLTSSCLTLRNHSIWTKGEKLLEVQDIFFDERFPNVVVAMDGSVVATWGREHFRV